MEAKVGERKPASAAPDVVTMDAIEVLKSLNKGRKMHELSIAMEQLVAAVRDTTKAGSITMKLTVEPAGKEAAQVFVTAEINGKLPRPDESSTLFFTTRANALVRDNPEQADLPFDR